VTAVAEKVRVLEVEPTRNYGLIRQLGSSHPRVFDAITDDDSPAREHWTPIEHPALVYLLALQGREPVGYWMLHPHASYLWECHTVLLPRVWGQKARTLARLGLEWLWANTPARRVFTVVPEFNQTALRFALDCGFEQYGKQPDAFLKRGRLWPVIYLGVSKEATCLPQ
jgi:RimJ/RimL family protein N-acetyltransferase